MKIKVYDSETGVFEGEYTLWSNFIYDVKHWSLKVALYNFWFNITGKE